MSKIYSVAIHMGGPKGSVLKRANGSQMSLTVKELKGKASLFVEARWAAVEGWKMSPRSS